MGLRRGEEMRKGWEGGLETSHGMGIDGAASGGGGGSRLLEQRLSG